MNQANQSHIGTPALALGNALDGWRLREGVLYRRLAGALLAEEDRVAARLTYEGTHHGQLFGLAPTGRRIRYSGAAFFTLSGDRIVSGWVLGDLEALRRQLGTPFRATT